MSADINFACQKVIMCCCDHIQTTTKTKSLVKEKLQKYLINFNIFVIQQKQHSKTVTTTRKESQSQMLNDYDCFSIKKIYCNLTLHYFSCPSLLPQKSCCTPHTCFIAVFSYLSQVELTF